MKWTLPFFILLVACGDASTAEAPELPVGEDAIPGSDVIMGELFVTLEAPDDSAIVATGSSLIFSARVAASDGLQFPLSVTWTSSVDGELASGEEGSDVVTFQTSSLEPGPHTVTLLVSDLGGRVGQDSVNILLDRPPEGDTVVAIAPEAPTSADPLEAQLLSAAIDPDGEEVVYSFSWFADGLPVPIAGALIPHTTTVRGQKWRVIATPSDGLTTGKAGEDEVVIGNAIPFLEAAQLFPSIGGTNTEFTCTPQGWIDADGDPEDFLIAWLVNGTAVQGQEDATITGAHYERGDELQCVLTPLDDYDVGSPVASEVIVIIDTPPTVDTALIDPLSGDKTTVFTCDSDGLSDADAGDEPTAHTLWVVNGLPLPGTTSTSFSAEGLSIGDAVRCRIIPVAGDVEGSPVDSTEVELGNAAPTGGAVVLEPIPPTEETGVTCVASDADDPDGDNVAYYYVWIVNDVPVDGVTGDFLSGEHYDKGDVIRCEATPFDGTDAGEAVSAKFSAVAANTPPTLTGAEITPDEGGKADTFTCAALGWSDVDPADSAEYTYGWKIDGADVPGGIFETLVPDDLGPGFLTCVITPGDGESWGTPVESSPALVVNHPPSITAVTLGPEPASEETTLLCAPSGWADQDGDEEAYIVTWTVDGAEIAGQTGLTLTGDHFDKTDIVICQPVPFDGTDQGQGKASNPVQIQNSPPSLGFAQLTPLAGGKLEPFTCTPGDDSDVDPADSVLFSYTWFVEGAQVIGAIDGTWIPGDLASAGDQLHCEVTPFDGADFGDPAASNQALVVNAPPSVDSVEVLPLAPTSDDTLTCDADGVFDPDGDDVNLATIWVLNESPLLGQTEQTLDPAWTEAGDVIRCQITPSDAANEGLGVWSADVVITDAPVDLVTPGVSVTPSDPEAGEDITCLVTYPGGLGDLWAEYVWKQNGEPVDGQTSSLLPGALVAACDVWVCEARVTDGSHFSPWSDDAAFVQALGGVPGGILWYSEHSYDPPTNTSYQTVNQWLSVEVAATRIDIPDDDLPLTITHVRALGAQNQGFTLRLYYASGGLPGAEIASVAGVGLGPGVLSDVELPAPVVVSQSPIWVGIQGLPDFWSVYGDGDGESTSNAAYTCLAFPGMGCLTPPSWGGLSSLGAPFSGLDDLILSLGSEGPGGGGCP